MLGFVGGYFGKQRKILSILRDNDISMKKKKDLLIS